MITPVVSVSLKFTADGTSSVLIFDLTSEPVNLSPAGFGRTVGLQQTSVTSSSTGAVSGVTYAISGSILTLTFNTPPPQLDTNSLLITYMFTALIQLASLQPLV